MSKYFVLALVVLVGCGGESAEERICIAANGCGALAAGNVDTCVDTLQTVDADRALSECADCLEARTCAEITGGACTPNCGPFSSVFANGSGSGGGNGGGGFDPSKEPSQLTPAELRMFCEHVLEQQGGPNRREVCNPQYSADTGSLDACVQNMLHPRCPLTIGEYLACYESVDGPCAVLTAAACDPLFNCD